MSDPSKNATPDTTMPKSETSAQTSTTTTTTESSKPVEIGGRDGPDPVRYGDWEKGGRCIDF